MRNYRGGSASRAFNDFLFIALLGIMVMFLIAFLMINPIAKEGVIDPKTEMMIVTEWDPKSVVDIDTWVRGPNGSVMSYQKPDVGYIVLERDDKGAAGDTIFVDDKSQTIFRNIEVVSINKLLPGEYVVNLHNYSTSDGVGKVARNNKEELPTPVKIQIIKLNPYILLYSLDFLYLLP